jgi:cysteine desulfurase family protein
MIYLDNAATSWPKPESVYEAVNHCLREEGGNPGRSSHSLAIGAAREISAARSALSELFGIEDPLDLVFTLNTTWALNLAMKGVLKSGDHVISGSMEHNAVSRPLYALEKRGVEVSRVTSSPSTGLDPDAVRAAIKKNTKLVVTCHASNVSGAISPVAEIGALCRDRGVLFLVDAAQSSGSIPLDVGAMRIDLLAFPGHKGLLGPQGTGCLYIAPSLQLDTIVEGGTGVNSREAIQPEDPPERYESGTPNSPGIAGLCAGARYLLEAGVEAIGRREAALCERLVRSLGAIPGVTVLGPPPGAPRAAVVSLVVEGMQPEDAAAILDQAFGIASRAGLHCAPDAHAALGTLESGALRLSPGPFTSEEDIDTCVEALSSIAKSAAV